MLGRSMPIPFVPVASRDLCPSSMRSNSCNGRVIIGVTKCKSEYIDRDFRAFHVIDNKGHPVIVVHEVTAFAGFHAKVRTAHKRGPACHVITFKRGQVGIGRAIKYVVSFRGPIREKPNGIATCEEFYNKSQSFIGRQVLQVHTANNTRTVRSIAFARYTFDTNDCAQPIERGTYCVLQV